MPNPCCPRRGRRAPRAAGRHRRASRWSRWRGRRSCRRRLGRYSRRGRLLTVGTKRKQAHKCSRKHCTAGRGCQKRHVVPPCDRAVVMHRSFWRCTPASDEQCPINLNQLAIENRISCQSSSRNFLDCRDYRVPYAGIVKRVAGCLDHPQRCVRPGFQQGMGRRWWAKKIVAALHDEPANSGQIPGI